MQTPVVLALLALVSALAAWRTVLWKPRGLPGVTRPAPLLLGHRGVRPVPGTAAAAEPDFPRENTRRAFLAALEAGLDGVECDVQLSADGVPVLFHDEKLAGATVTARSYAELTELDPQLTTLEELLELAGRYPGTLVNIELKLYSRRGRGLERKVVRAVQRAGLADRVLISSFDPLALARMRLAAPGLRTALLTSDKGPRWLASGAAAGWLHVDALHPRHRQADARLLERARARGLMVNVWTVNDAEVAARLVAAGASGIIGDDPELLRRAAGREG